MRIGEIYGEGSFGLSIEIFPPKSSEGDEALLRTLDRLSIYEPAFVSCTYVAPSDANLRTPYLSLLAGDKPISRSSFRQENFSSF